MLTRLPELKDAIEKENDYWKGEDPPSHVLFAEVFNQSDFMYNLLIKETDIMLIKKVFEFFEDMASCDDDEVKNLLQVTLLEYLWGDFDVLNRAHKYMHAQTRKLSDELQVYF